MDYVSVVLPTYNRCFEIKQAIESVLSQTYKWLEIIVVDDCSNDDTRLTVLGIDDSRIRYIRLERNSGPSAARNQGVKAAKYEWIAFQDSDDIWFPQKLERQMELVGKGAGFVTCSYEIEKEVDRYCTFPPKNFGPLDSENLTCQLKYRSMIGTPTILINRQLFESIGGFDEELRGLEDWDLVIRAAEKEMPVFYDDILLFASGTRTGVNSNHINIARSAIRMLSKYQDPILKETLCLVAMMHMAEVSDSQIKNELFDRLKEVDVSVDAWRKNAFSYMSGMSNLRKMSRISSALSSDSFLDELIRSYDMKNRMIAIYGLGNLGYTLLNRLSERGVNVSTLIDTNIVRCRNRKVGQANVLDNDNVSLVIITVLGKFEEIKKGIRNHTEAKCLDLEKMVFPDGCDGSI